jgi:hypothetical protein
MNPPDVVGPRPSFWLDYLHPASCNVGDSTSISGDRFRCSMHPGVDRRLDAKPGNEAASPKKLERGA